MHEICTAKMNGNKIKQKIKKNKITKLQKIKF